MENSLSTILTQAQQEISEIGVLSFHVRRKLWLALGPWEVQEEDASAPRTLTESMKKRAELALACAKKVSRIWSAYDSEDKRPQKLIKEIRAYLDGRHTVRQLSEAGDEMENFMYIVDEEADSTAPCAGMAAWKAMLTALYDEPMLEERYADAQDSDLDSYDWDAAREASEAWAGADEEAGPGKRRVRRMKFWAWYLEEAARLLGDEEYRFPPKAIKAFAEKQDPPKTVPEEVTLDSLVDYLGVGDLRYCCRMLVGRSLFEYRDSPYYHIVTRRAEEGGICPKCKKMTAEVDYYIGGNALEADLPGNVAFMVVEEIPFFRCPQHPNELISACHEYANTKALFQRYIAGADRAQALIKQMEERAILRFGVDEHGVMLNDRALDCFSRRLVEANLIPGLEWMNREDDSFAVDLSVFGPHVVFMDLSYEEFTDKYPRRVRQTGERMTEIDFGGVWVRCYLDERGALARVETTMRFRVRVENPARDKRKLVTALQVLGMSEAEAEEGADALAEKKEGRNAVNCLYGLERAEAKRVWGVLCNCGVESIILPRLIAQGRDGW